MWRMRIECWIPKATNIHLEYLIFIDFTLQHWLHERISVLRYTHTAYLDCTKFRRIASAVKEGRENNTF